MGRRGGKGCLFWKNLQTNLGGKGDLLRSRLEWFRCPYGSYYQKRVPVNLLVKTTKSVNQAALKAHRIPLHAFRRQFWYC